MQSCDSDLKVIAAEKISLHKWGQAKKGTTVAHLSVLVEFLTNTCECWMCWLCTSCAGGRVLCWLANSSELWDRTAGFPMFFRSSAYFTNKNKLCLFCSPKFSEHRISLVPLGLLHPQQRHPLTAGYYWCWPQSWGKCSGFYFLRSQIKFFLIWH